MTATRIVRARVRRVKLPLNFTYVSAMYVMDSTVRVIVELETEAGIVGLGETVGTEEVFALAQRLSKDLIGRDALDRQRARMSFARSVFDNRNGRNGWSAFAAIELALWDIAGRRCGAPLADMIGGRARRDIDVVCPLPACVVDGPCARAELAAHFADKRNIERLVAFARAQRARHGFRCFKYKSAGASAAWDVAATTALREALGDAALRFDPNAAYPPAEAIALCARMDHLGLEFFEDPTDDIEGLASLRARVRTKVATNMCVIQLDHLPTAIRRRPVDVVLADLFMWGGVETYRMLAAVTEAYGLELAVHSLFETSIGTVANLHLAAALPQIRRANDSGLHFMAADVVADPPAIVGGRITLPDGPGLGVTLDETRIAALTIAEATFH
jgi:glucarate dehydratase